ncbi:hypothetical protein Trydic_g18789 [Trypoxylus dichotomus]
MAAAKAVIKVGTKGKNTKMDRQTTNRLTFPKLPAYKMVKSTFDYRNRKKTPLPPLQWDTPPKTYKYYYYAAKHKLDTLTEEANKMKKTIPLSDELFKKNWDQQQDVADAFKHLIELCDEFVTQNEEKRRRFLLKMIQSKQAIMQKDEEEKELRNKITHMKDIKQKMEKMIKDFEIYQNFLATVVEADSQFKNADTVVSRFEALHNATNSIVETEQRLEKVLKEKKESLKKLVDEKLTKYNELNALLDSFTRRYNKARSAARRAEYFIVKIHDEAFLRKQEVLMVKESCWRIYEQIKKKKFSNAKLPKEDIVGQLQEIRKVLSAFKMVFKKLCVRHSCYLKIE